MFYIYIATKNKGDNINMYRSFEENKRFIYNKKTDEQSEL